MTHKQWQRFKAETKRIKVANLAGITDIKLSHIEWDGERILVYISGDKVLNLPDYLNDLNAMHDLEQRFIRTHICRVAFYRINLARLRTAEEKWACPDGAYIFDATADERAEAFALTLTNKEWGK